MKLLHYVEIENFKCYAERQHIDLEHPAVLIGPNNCGKTSVLQAIALWSIGLKTWRTETENSKAEKKTGKALNRLNILSVPVPKTRHFWHNLRVTKKDLRITVGVDVSGTAHPVTMIFRHHASDELVYCEPEPESLDNKAAFRAACDLDLALLYPMSGISADEAVILPQRVEFFLGRGSTAEVLRNICLQVFQQAPRDWRDIVGLMRRLFQVDLNEPQVNEKGGVDITYQQDGTSGEMDLGLSGRGFQQMLLIFAHLHLHKSSVLLIDEPDAHLEILRQQQVYVLLRDIAHKNGCQVVLVTHSEVLLREALDNNLSLILHGRVENLAKKEDIRASLKHFGAEHYVRARETGHVLYVEGGTDVDMLRAFARKLNHPVTGLLEDGGKLNIYYLEDNFPEPERSPEAELQRVEGGYGLSADKHFGALKRMLPDLRGLAIQDNDGKGRADAAQGGLSKLVWKRYEAENYFVSPELLLANAKQQSPESDLFHGAPEEILQELLLERVFDNSHEDLENYDRADSSTKKTLWRAQTQNRKLSDFAEEFFRRLAAKTATPMLCHKGSLHELVMLCDAAELNGDVKEKLDALLALLKPDMP
jgi:ABC-type branched-subunit amino acid transport system ATPase component